MKKLLLSTLAFCLISVQAFAFNGTIGRSTALKADKSVDASSVEKQFLNVKNVHASEIPAGSAVVLDVSADDGASVIISTTAGLSPLCVMVKACAVNALCACQNYGHFESALFDSTAAASVAGKRLYLSTQNAGYIAARSSDLASEVAGGVFYDAASASASVQVFLKM